MSSAMWQSRAVERSRELDIDQGTLLASVDMVSGALGRTWLEKQATLAERAERTISDVHPLYRDMTSASDGAIITVCEVARYLQHFASDPAIPGVLNDLRADKYESTLFELAMAYRWHKAGALVTLQPPVPGGTADFKAVIHDTHFVVEASTFPADVFLQPRFRATTIVVLAAESIISNSFPVAVKVKIREYIDGDFEGRLREAVREACRSLIASLRSGELRPVSQDFVFCSVEAERVTEETEAITDQGGEPTPLQSSDWDICARITAAPKPPGTFPYMAVTKEGTETIRAFVKLPPRATDQDDDRIARKLRKEARQLRGIRDPRVVLLDISAVSSDALHLNMEGLQSEVLKLMRSTPELACVWLLSRGFSSEMRYQYRGLFIPNGESVYQIPASFLNKLMYHEWRWDFLNDRAIQNFRPPQQPETACQ